MKDFVNFIQVRVKILKLVLVLSSILLLFFCVNFLKGSQEIPTPLNCKGFSMENEGRNISKKENEERSMNSSLTPFKEVEKTVPSLIPSFCDFSDYRYDICDMKGDARIHGSSSSIFFVRPKKNGGSQGDEIVRIRPYPRKFDHALMDLIGEVKIISSVNPRDPYNCGTNHSIPAVIFSNQGLLGNYYHSFSDILIPLFITSREFNGEVQFLITSMTPWWVAKFKKIFSKLSNYPIIDLKNDNHVHCYPRIIVNLYSHKKISIDPSRAPNNYSMVDFAKFLRETYSLEKNSISINNKKPKLLILTRAHTRLLVNIKEIIATAEGLGYEVLAQESSQTVEDFAKIVNSCDVMIGVYGAGLTNLVFLPDNAVFIQIAPLGKPSAREDFGLAALDRKLQYIHYAISEEESTLLDTYPRDHPVFTDPMSIHMQGYSVSFKIYLIDQNMRINVTRFAPVLIQALDLIRKN